MADLKFEEVQRNRVKGTVKSVLEVLKNIDIQTLEEETEIESEDALSRELLEKYRKQLLLAKSSPNEFRIGLYKFFTRTASFIKHNKLIPNYFDLCYFVYTDLYTRRDLNRVVLVAYQNMLMQQASHLYKHKLVYGVAEQRDALICDEIYPKLDYPLYEVMKLYGRNFSKLYNKDRVTKKLLDRYKKYGYNINNKEDALEYILNEQSITRAMFQMVPFINETTLDIHCDKHYKSVHGVGIAMELTAPEEIIIRIKNYHKRTLPFSGLEVECYNCGDITRILMKERIYCDRLHLLFKIQVGEQGYYNGFWDIERDIDFTLWKDSKNGKMYHELTMGLIKRVYAIFVCNRDDDVIQLIDEDTHWHGKEPRIRLILESSQEVSRSGGVDKLDRSKYNKEESVVEPFIRKLRDGQKASKEAIERALKVGYILKEGETFVRKHTKAVYKKIGD